MASLPALLERDPTFLPTREAARALLTHLEEVYTDRDWAHAPDVRRALVATLAWLDAVPLPPARVEAVGLGPVWAATQALVQRLENIQGYPGWSQDPVVLALVKLAGQSQPQSLADLRSRQLPLEQVALLPDTGFIPRLARAWHAHLQTLPFIFARLLADRSIEEIPAKDLAHPTGYLAAFMGLTHVAYPNRAMLAVSVQEVTPPLRGPLFPLGGMPQVPSPTVPVFVWLDLMAEALAQHVHAFPPQRDNQERAVVVLDPIFDRLKRAIASDQIAWHAAVSYERAQRQAGYDLSQPLSQLGKPSL